jgi:hypothetical protein
MLKTLSRLTMTAALSLAALVPAAAQTRPEKLVVGLLPGESAPTVMRLNEPLRAYLEKRLGIPVELFVGANYAAKSGSAFPSSCSSAPTTPRRARRCASAASTSPISGR